MPRLLHHISARYLITNERTGETFTAEPFPPFIAEIIEAGGLVARTRAKIAAAKAQEA